MANENEPTLAARINSCFLQIKGEQSKNSELKTIERDFYRLIEREHNEDPDTAVRFVYPEDITPTRLILNQARQMNIALLQENMQLELLHAQNNLLERIACSLEKGFKESDEE